MVICQPVPALTLLDADCRTAPPATTQQLQRCTAAIFPVCHPLPPFGHFFYLIFFFSSEKDAEPILFNSM